MRTYVLAALTAFMPAVASGQSAGPGPKQNCVDVGTLISAQTMESSRSFSWNGNNATGGYDVAMLSIELTDANTSITRFDQTCTVSIDGNSTDLTPQYCGESATCTQTDSGVAQKASPGTKKWPLKLNVSGYPDFECTFAVGTGTGAAADLLTVKGRLCTR